MGQEYFEILKTELDKAYSLAQECRAKGFDPERHVEVPIAKDVAARVEELVGPRGISGIIRELEHSGMPRPEVAFVIVEKIVKGEIIQGDQRTLIEQAVRTGVSILTEGVLVAPTEGISDVRINENPDGSSYVSVFFSGPIRSAGGTVAALSVALADYARKLAGVGDYRPTDKEVARYVEEINVYEYRCHHLQYKPPDAHVEHIVKNCPVCIDGDPTEDAEVSVHRDIPRIKSNRVRGGVPLVVCEGMAAKAPKVLKYAKKFGLEWDWLQNVIKVKKKEDHVEIKPDPTYLEGLVAGRPVFAYPMAKGGFRLRYGRSRTNGIMARNIHPATMILLDSFIANGTHMKVERPGKGCVVTVCDTLEPPVVKLMDGSVLKAHSIAQAQELKPALAKILFLGDMLITFGDFLKTNHPLMPSGYCAEWWIQEAKAGGAEIPEGKMGAKEAFELSRKYSIPLHPDFTPHWGDISLEQLRVLPPFLSKGELRMDSGEISGLSLPNSPEGKAVLEDLLLEHSISQDGKIELNGNDAYSILSSLGMLKGKEIGAAAQINESLSVLENICELSGVTIRNKAPTYIGGRMGRPEKAKERAMEGKTHILFPTASEKNRSIIKRYRGLKAREGEQSINAEISRYRCGSCKALTFFSRCHSCGEEAKPERVCQKCGVATAEKKHCDMPTNFYDRRPVPLVDLFEKAREELGFTPSEVNGVKGLFSQRKVPERLEKGFLRAKHDIFVFKDGTCRFDATDTPITHFRISEIGQTPEGIRALGYTVDCKGAPITNADQVVSLFQQDIVVSSHGMDYVMRIAAFVDDSLVHIYGLKPFYNFRNREDLFGHLAVGLSPHTSAGVLCRIIGFTNANVGYGHPYFHTAKRRNCFSGETTIPILENGSWKIAKLKEFVEKNLGASAQKDEAGTAEYSSLSGLKTLAFNPDSKKFEVAEITHVSKHITQDHLLEIATKSGRKITVTKEHPFPNCGKKKMAMDAANLYVPAKISIPEKDLKGFDFSLLGDSSGKAIEGDVFIDEIISKKIVRAKEDYTYSVTVAPHHTVLASGLVSHQCDGDEDSIMLLLDCLLNFSRSYLSDKRGGTMDAPLTLTPQIDPREVDDEVHCMEVVHEYPLEFYKAAERNAYPGDVKLRTVKDLLGKDEQYGDLLFTHDTATLNEGPMRTMYVELGSIPEKIAAEFELHSKLRPVDLRDTAERLILSHFIPDLYGNLRSYSRQTFRCSDCNLIYRRVPLAGKCTKCGGKLLLTINKGGIVKYLSISQNMVEKYALPAYLGQRLALLEKEINSVFEDDKIKQTGLSDFM